LANRVLSIPMSLVGGAIGQVFLSSAAEARRNGTLGALVLKLHTKLAHVGFAPALLLVLVGPELFALVFGSDWRQAGEFARWMAPWLYFVFTLSPLSTLFAVLENQREGLAFQIILLVVRLAAIFVGSIFLDIGDTIILFAAVSALCWIGLLFWIGVASGNTAFAMVRPTFSACLPAFACALPLVGGLQLEAIKPYSWVYGFGISALMIAIRWIFVFKKSK